MRDYELTGARFQVPERTDIFLTQVGVIAAARHVRRPARCPNPGGAWWGRRTPAATRPRRAESPAFAGHARGRVREA
jgi:hypothetical protein